MRVKLRRQLREPAAEVRDGDATAGVSGKRVLMLLATGLYPLDGRVQREATSLAAAGYEVTVICPRYPRRQVQPWQEVIDGVHVYRYPPPVRKFSVIGYAWGAFYSPLAMFLLSLFVWARRGFDVVHAHNPPDNLVFIGAFYKLLGKRFVFDHHDLSPEMYGAVFARRHQLVLRALLALEKLSCRVADRVVATNHSYKQIEMERDGVPERKITVVRNGPDLEFFRPVAPDPVLRPEGKLLLGYVGAIGLHDGMEYLLRAVHHLVHSLGRTDFFCLLVGGGKQQAQMKALGEEMGLSEYVSFVGPVPHADVPRYLSSFDICLSPEPSNSYNDRSTMIKIGEYMALGKPIVAFDLPEHRITAQDAALYARSNDELDFARQIARLMDDPQLRAQMGQKGRARAQAELAWPYQAQALVAMYDSLLGHPAKEISFVGNLRNEV